MIWVVVLLVVGVNLIFWGSIGLLRLVDDVLLTGPDRRFPQGDGRHRGTPLRSSLPPAGGGGSTVRRDQLAVLMPAHNEEMVIGASLAAITELVPAAQVHVVSDYSSDATVQIATGAGVTVFETPTNVGKAGALSYALREGGLLDRYEAVMILDADTQLHPRYFERALPMLDDPEVVAVAGCAHTRWQRAMGPVGEVIVSHRQRVYALTQWLLKYGQTWRAISATHIVPGFASIYRTRALREIAIDAPGLVIEDFNMTFEIYAKDLGQIAFHPGAIAYTQDPDTYRDYVKQMKRWCLGLWQTIRRHRPRKLVFGLSLTAMITELVTSSIAFVLLPLVALLIGAHSLVPEVAAVPLLGDVSGALAGELSLLTLAMVVFLPDYALTVAVAVAERRPRYLLVGLLFIPMRVTDAVIALGALPRAWLTRSTGTWTSPTRRAVEPSSGTATDTRTTGSDPAASTRGAMT